MLSMRREKASGDQSVDGTSEDFFRPKTKNGLSRPVEQHDRLRMVDGDDAIHRSIENIPHLILGSELQLHCPLSIR